MQALTFTLLPFAALVSHANAAHYDVNVGKGTELKFVPETLNAAAGDTITYHFFAKNHSVIQSSFDDPCHPVSKGFFSGFTPSASPDTASPTTWTITVNDTKPVWVYCGQGDHCQKGMVHAINAPKSGNTIDAFRSKAATASPSSSPAGGLPIGGLRKLRVDVGIGGLKFTPNNIIELAGTVVEFSFNPANHSVVQSSFDDPCHPLNSGFSSGFIPTQVSPSGALFSILIKDAKPIWFYCAQTAKTHCQAGMVGSINAPSSGNTLEVFIQKAAQSSASTIPPQAPLGGTLTVNGTNIPTLNGNVLNAGGLNGGTISSVPKPGEPIPDEIAGMAGGKPPMMYWWPPQLSNNATEFLQLLQFLDNILIEVLYDGYEKLSGGAWAGVFPKSIVDTIGSMAAQALVHRSTATDSLQHYGKPLVAACEYELPSADVDAYLEGALALLLLEIGLLIDVAGLVASTDGWLVPALATTVGAKSRMAAVVNLMQAHAAAAAPREAMVPAPLAYSYAMQHFVARCPDGAPPSPAEAGGKPLPELKLSATATNGRTSSILVELTPEWKQGGASLWLAWIGPWGGLRYTEVNKADGKAGAPEDLYGHVWAVLVREKKETSHELYAVAVAGPALVWISDL